MLPIFILGIRKERKAKLFYGVPAFLLRRALYALSLVVIQNAPLVGLQLTIFSTFMVNKFNLGSVNNFLIAAIFPSSREHSSSWIEWSFSFSLNIGCFSAFI